MNWLQNRLFKDPPCFWGGLAAAIVAAGSAAYSASQSNDAMSSSRMDSWAKYINEMNRQDTSYRRLVSDLEAAGINPMMAAGNMQPASAGNVQQPFYGETAGRGVTDAINSAGKGISDMLLKGAQTDYTEAAEATERQKKLLTQDQQGVAQATREILNDQGSITSLQGYLAGEREHALRDFKRSHPDAFDNMMKADLFLGTELGKQTMQLLNNSAGTIYRDIKDNVGGM